MGAGLSIGINIAVPLIGGMAIGQGTAAKIKNGWYDKLNKPGWTPPNWLFPVAWSLLYVAMGTASGLIWKDFGFTKPQHVLYICQLAANFAWPMLFFNLEQTKLALVDITGLLGLVIATTVKFQQKSDVAAYLLYPYIGWVAYATALNVAIVAKNPDIGWPKMGKQENGDKDSKEPILQQATT